MVIIDAFQLPVNREPMTLASISKREVSIHRAAQVLADAISCRAGAGHQPLSTLPVEDRRWYLATVRSLFELHEKMTAAPLVPVPTVPLTPEAMRMIARQQARDEAHKRGHRMGLFHFGDDGTDEACCAQCGRSVLIDPERAISGPALDEGCITEADRG